MERGLGAVQVLDERDDAALVLELVFFLAALVLDRDAHALVQKGELAEPLREDVEAQLHDLEHLGVGLESDARPGVFRFPHFFERRLRRAALVALLVDLAVALDLDLQVLGERVDDRQPDAVQPAGDFVGSLVEFSAGVELGEHDLGGGDLLGRVQADRNAAPVVGDGHAVVDVNFDFDLIAKPRQGFVDGVIHHLVDQVVQPPLAGVPDVHARPLSDGVEALEDFNIIGVVVGWGRSFV